MYAYRRLYTRKWNHEKADEQYAVTVTCGGKPVAGIDQDRISSVNEEVMYWRKANHIHGWFVDNVQNGFDECKEAIVPMEQLIELRDICSRVLDASKVVNGEIVDARVAHELLPRREGFFFGSMSYDEQYIDDVKRTRDWIHRMLDENLSADIIYYAWW